MQSDGRKGCLRRVILCMIAVLGFVPTVAVAWTPTSPQVSVAVFGSTGADYATSVAVDGSGNIYTVGFFNGTVDFDPGAGTSYLASTGADDVFVLKLSSTGDFVWARGFGGANSDYASSVTVDGAGNVLAAGYFSGTVDFDPGAGTTNLSSVGGVDVFVSKFSSTGDFVWARGFGGANSDSANSVAVDGAGNVLAAGYFSGTVDFDPGAGTTNLTSAGGADAFVSKLSSSGHLVWVSAFGGVGGGGRVGQRPHRWIFLRHGGF